MMTVICHKCGSRHQFIDKMPRTEVCAKCDEDLHCCKNCKFYDTSVANQCREPVADYVRDKERANFCDYFEPRPLGAAVDPAKPSAQDNARKAWENLFKK